MPSSASRNFKRSHSESEDCDDDFSEGSKEHNGADSCQMLSRKKRRGIIEKRRRDRINTSLLELRRLVPSAYEKQGSAKLEKAEILQMTVDHLKNLHSKGADSLGYDPSKFVMNAHNMGFQECAAEVARYLVSVEGLDIQDPLRMRLISHLQCFAAQREMKQPPPPHTWYGSNTSHQTYASSLSPPPPPLPLDNSLNSTLNPPPLNASHSSSLNSSSLNSSSLNSSSLNSSGLNSSSSYDSPKSTAVTLTPLTTISSEAYHHQYHPHQYQYPPPELYHHQHHQQGYQMSSDPSVSSQMKPYRPWGTELAY